jgi:hypothetical protein
MADKFRKTAPIKITFADGEQPSSSKLTGIAQQTRAALKIIEKVVGDTWNQSGDSVTQAYPLQIVNLARVLGEVKYLNPAIYPMQYTFKFRDTVGYRARGYTYGYLFFKPKSGTSYAFYNTAGQFTTWTANEYDVDATGEYNISTNGKWRTNEELISQGEQVEYSVDPTTDYNADLQIFPSVIPDPRHLSGKFSGCRLTKVSGHYYLYLPPRRPLDFSGSGFNSSKNRPARYPQDVDIGLSKGNEATTLDTNNLRYWQSDTVAAMDHAHYRYSLPREIVNAHSGMSPGTEYPANFLYLWDQATSTVLEGIIFRKPYDLTLAAKPWVIEISSSTVTVNLDDYLSSPDDETEPAYSSTGLSLITGGASITRSLWDLASRFLVHTHDNFGPEMPIRHYRITHVNPPKDSVYTHNGRYPAAIPAWPQSRYLSDDHTYLLSRTGSQGIGTRHRDENDNAMLGHLVLANSGADSGGVFLNPLTPDNSFRLYFGSTDGACIFGSAGKVVTDIPGNYGYFVKTNSSQRLAINGAGFFSFGSGAANNYAPWDFTSESGVEATIRVRGSSTNQNSNIMLGEGGSGDTRYAWIDFVADSTYTDYGLRIIRGNTGANSPTTITHRGTGAFTFSANEAAWLQFQTSATRRMSILSNGNVGIGNVDPLDVLDINPSSGSSIVRIRSQGSGATSGIEIGTSGSGNRWSYIDLTGDDTYTDFALRISRGASGANASSQIVHRGTGGLYFTTQDAAPLYLQTSNTNRVVVLSDGKTGIGPSDPTTVLDVNPLTGDSILTVRSQASGATSALTLGESGVGNRIAFIDLVTDATYTDYGLRIIRAAGVNVDSQILHRGTGNLTLNTNEAAPILFQTTNATRMTISSGGDVGIGSAPTTLQGTFLAAARELSIITATNYGPAVLKLGGGTGQNGNSVIELSPGGFLSGDYNEWTCNIGVNLVQQYNGTSSVFVTPRTTTGYGYRGMFMNYNGNIRFFQSQVSTTAGATITPTEVVTISASTGNTGIKCTNPDTSILYVGTGPAGTVRSALLTAASPTNCGANVGDQIKLFSAGANGGGGGNNWFGVALRRWTNTYASWQDNCIRLGYDVDNTEAAGSYLELRWGDIAFNSSVNPVADSSNHLGLSNRRWLDVNSVKFIQQVQVGTLGADAFGYTAYVEGTAADATYWRFCNSAYTRISHATGIIYGAVGYNSYLDINAAGNLTEAHAFRVAGIVKANTGTLANAYGLSVAPFGTGGITNAYGIYVGDISGAATINYAIKTGWGSVVFGDGTYVKPATGNALLAIGGATSGTQSTLQVGNGVGGDRTSQISLWGRDEGTAHMTFKVVGGYWDDGYYEDRGWIIYQGNDNGKLYIDTSGASRGVVWKQTAHTTIYSSGLSYYGSTFQVSHASATAGTSPVIAVRRAGGTPASLAICPDGGTVLKLQAEALNAGLSSYEEIGSIQFVLDQYQSGQCPSSFHLYVHPWGYASPVERLGISYLGMATHTVGNTTSAKTMQILTPSTNNQVIQYLQIGKADSDYNAGVIGWRHYADGDYNNNQFAINANHDYSGGTGVYIGYYGVGIGNYQTGSTGQALEITGGMAISNTSNYRWRTNYSGHMYLSHINLVPQKDSYDAQHDLVLHYNQYTLIAVGDTAFMVLPVKYGMTISSVTVSWDVGNTGGGSGRFEVGRRTWNQTTVPTSNAVTAANGLNYEETVNNLGGTPIAVASGQTWYIAISNNCATWDLLVYGFDVAYTTDTAVYKEDNH